MKNNYELIASGEKWIQYDVKSTFRAITEMIDQTKSSLILTIYIISNNEILEKVKEALDRNVDVEVFIYKDKEVFNDVTHKVLKLTDEYYNFTVHEVTEKTLHAKVLISDKKQTLIGSANFTGKAMHENYELGILVDDAELAYNAEKIIKGLIK